MSRLSATVSFIALVGQAFAQSAAVSNACSTTVYAANAGQTLEALSPGGLRLDPIGTGSNTRVSKEPNDDSPAIVLEYTPMQDTLLYDVSVVNGNPFASDGFTLGAANADCTFSDCGPNAQNCPCVIYSDSSPGCSCPVENNSVTLTICSG